MKVFDKFVEIVFKNEENRSALVRFTCSCCLLKAEDFRRPDSVQCVKNYASWCSNMKLLEATGRNFTHKVKDSFAKEFNING